MSAQTNHIYIIYSKAAPGIVLDLKSDEDVKATVPCHGYEDAHETLDTFSQQWLFEEVYDQAGVFKLLNLHTGTFLDLEYGSKRDGAQVQGKYLSTTNFGKEQHWKMIQSGLDFQIQNVSSGTYLELDLSRGSQVQCWTSNNNASQQWTLRRVSRSAEEIEAMVKKNLRSRPNITCFFKGGTYIVLPRSVIAEIHERSGLSNMGWREQVFDSDDFSFIMKAEVAQWGNGALRPDGFSILFGIMFGEKPVPGSSSGLMKRVYNWYLTEDLNGLRFFDPQDGWEFYPDTFGFNCIF